ncbi:MAG: hypothetical protein JW941_01670, partial [Candidatus Coatesbacteria bacterium]|nr:hypothetical protein [Candidatus Coatesbacteria bacterium]
MDDAISNTDDRIEAKQPAPPRWWFYPIAVAFPFLFLAYVSASYYFLGPFLRNWDGLEWAKTITSAIIYLFIGMSILQIPFKRRIARMSRKLVTALCAFGLVLLLIIAPAIVILDWVSR